MVTLWFSDAFWGYRKGPLPRNGLIGLIYPELQNIGNFMKQENDTKETFYQETLAF